MVLSFQCLSVSLTLILSLPSNDGKVSISTTKPLGRSTSITARLELLTPESTETKLKWGLVVQLFHFSLLYFFFLCGFKFLDYN